TKNNPNNVSVKALELLTNIPAGIAILDGNTIIVERIDSCTKCSYMQKAYDLDGTKFLCDLAFYYMHGLHQTEAFLVPDYAQAYALLKQHAKIAPSATAWSKLAEVCYFQGAPYYDKA